MEVQNSQILTLRELERLYILDTLQKKENNKVETAKVLGISVKTLYNKLNKYSVSSNERSLQG